MIEIVSNREGNELGSKLRNYAQIGVGYYAVFDPIQQLEGPVLQIYQLQGIVYVPTTETWLEQVGLGLTLWQGVFEGKANTWLRWCDREGNIILSGAERAEQEHQRAERLAEQLRMMGVDPNL